MTDWQWCYEHPKEAAAEIDRLRPILEAAKLYEAWAKRTGDYPHDEEGCIAHEAIREALRAYEQKQEPSQ